MAASYFFIAAAVALLISPAFSQRCKSHTPTSQNVTFPHCLDLPRLNATLHWRYERTARGGPVPTLSIAYSAPSSSDGWVAWALNPTGTGMIGAQALIAFRAQNESYVVRTYNITAFSGIQESAIAYDVHNRSAVYSGGRITIFATLALPGSSDRLNQVWQVGPVRNGVPAIHAMGPDNTNSTGTLSLRGSDLVAPSASPGGEGSLGGAPSAGGGQGGNGPSGNGCSRVWGVGVGLYGGLGLLWAARFGF